MEDKFEIQEPEVVEPTTDFEQEPQTVEDEVQVEEPSEFEQLQTRYNELENNYNELNTKYEALEKEFDNFREASSGELDALRNKNTELQTTVDTYAAKEAQLIEENKGKLVDKYAAVLDADEINNVRASIANFSYEELESKLAISFANKQISDSKVEMVPLPEPEESTFASIMKNYKK